MADQKTLSLRNYIDKWARRTPVLVAVLMVTYSSQSLLITASKTQGEFLYDHSVVVLLAEILKLFFAILMLPEGALAKLPSSFPSSWVYATPAVLYMVQNGLIFKALLVLSPPEYQLLNNMKLFTTAITYRLVVQREQKVVQWLALTLLALGMSLSSYDPIELQQSPGSGTRSGVVLMMAISLCSSFAGAANERLVKGSKDVYQANVWLYTYGSIAQVLHIQSSQRIISLEGFTSLTWAIVVCNAVLGQSIAFLFRYADSIVKVYTTCMTIVFTTAVSVFLFDFQVKFQMVAGYTVCVISLCLYYLPA
eukprot:CAMPEP_0178427112 /NCGR_PEP_ID=MMETSP0689_2-20121128/29576_1 /TAXON_ID=160604 /ORGANISM="Amphidinium massartii, Strain CS-259" /LENGTH=307 /DNA_ID=CAMNT_0020048807 /DNA_START=27 /DNA_END=946 /DNA_ORIENTATION=+